MPPFEPALEEDLSDAHIANLLAADARAASQRYSSQGLAALLGSKVSSAPKAKPNTRFLKNLVKNTDSHNDRLKRKEEAERREKLRKLDEQDEERRKAETNDRCAREDDEDDRVRKRRKRDPDGGEEDIRRNGSDKHSRGRDKKRHRRRYERRNSSSEFSEPDVRPTSTSPSRPKSERKHRRSRKQDATDSDDKDQRKPNSHRKHKRRRSRSPVKLRLSPQAKDSPTPPPKDNNQSSPSASTKPVTPPPTNSKGRLSKTSPTTAALVDEDEDDWHNALSALRDRENYARIQASRLLAAGLPSPDVKKWASSGINGSASEGRVEDVKWKGPGEEREWDRGKASLAFSDDEVGNGVDYGGREVGKRVKVKNKGSAGEGWKRSGGLLRGFRDALGK